MLKIKKKNLKVVFSWGKEKYIENEWVNINSHWFTFMPKRQLYAKVKIFRCNINEPFISI